MKNKNINPLVSVIMPVYNAENYLVEAIESILNQTYANFEFIIIDDCSTDSSSRILASYQKKYPKLINLIRTKHNLNGGGDRCANDGLQIAKGKYIARMDSDDIALPARLEKQVDYLEKNKDVFLVGSTAHVIDKNGLRIGDKLVPTNPEEIYKAYSTFHPLIHPTIMLRRIHNNKPFQYIIKYGENNDYYTFFLLLCRGYKFVNLAEPLLLYRIHGKNYTFDKMKQKFLNTLRIRVEMILHNNYKMTLKGAFTNFCQAGVILLLPEAITLKIYMLSKGIIKLSDLYKLPSIKALSVLH